MKQDTTNLEREVSDSELEFIERILFSEYNKALENKSKGHEVSKELLELEKAMESITTIRKTLQNRRESSIEKTAKITEKTL